MSHPPTGSHQTTFKGESTLTRRRKTVSRTTVRTQLDQLRSTGRSAQQQDGYLNVHYTVVEPGERWTNIRDMHELYNGGHLIEAAIAHKEYYKNNLLLEPIEKYLSLITEHFGCGEGQLKGYPGDPEIELSLFRLSAATGNTGAFDLAQYFLTDEEILMEMNGNTHTTGKEKREAKARGCGRTHILNRGLIGHAVRAGYLLTAVADMLHLSAESGKVLPNAQAWSQTLHKLWVNMVDRKMYLTGGIGTMTQWEGFGNDYFLPQGTDEGGCYAETCASIAFVMLAEQMLHLDLDSRYADVIELCLYNTIMTAMSLDGKYFTYINQLASSGTDKNAREGWFWCACCPPKST
ncbi:DUF1680 domain-containing protein [Fusarium mundagurra]|uniref:DUF1680 domain-containing protein n=1 Tax=Fusarium mundagurra TaxID=1567541 RepID=A0A8H5XQ34_9HYPO|nr:DUF1680 domain-containing protein [Fusarium mundagurra]